MKTKPSDTHARQFSIENALASLLFGEVPEELRPLAEAVRNHDWRAISNAALSFENAARDAEVRFHAEIRWIAWNPARFGVETLAKCDVRRIAQTLIPEFSWPKDERDLWRKLGLDLPEGRGTENENALNRWEREHKAEKVNDYTLARLTFAAAIRDGRFTAEIQRVIDTGEPVQVSVKKLRAVILPTDSGGTYCKIVD